MEPTTLTNSDGSDSYLKLGDIIRINNNKDKEYLIDYIDEVQIELLDRSNYRQTFTISEDGIIDGVKDVEIIARNPKEGYALQYGYDADEISLSIKGEYNGQPFHVIGRVVNLEDDIIELWASDQTTLFIDFGYKGLPKTPLHIQNITIEQGDAHITRIPRTMTAAISADDDVHEFSEEWDTDIGSDSSSIPLIEASASGIPKTMAVLAPSGATIRIPMSNIEIGDVANIQYVVGIHEKNYRYDIDIQTNDLLQSMMQNIPADKQTPNAINAAHQSVKRFVELRKITSIYDANNNVSGFIQPSPNDRPLSAYLSQLKCNLPWVVYVAKARPKLSSISSTGDDDDDVSVTAATIYDKDDYMALQESFKQYRNDKTALPNNNKYIELHQKLAPLMTPFIEPTEIQRQSILVESKVGADTRAILDSGNFYSTHSSKLTSSTSSHSRVESRFYINQYNTGWTYLSNESGDARQVNASKTLASIRTPMTRNDEIYIDSILMLPETAVQFSRIHLPETNIMIRSQLGQKYMNYWEILNNATEYRAMPIDSIETDVVYDPAEKGGNSTFLSYITHYPSSIETPDSRTTDTFKKYLDCIIPRTRKLLHHVKKYLHDRLSVVSFIQGLEPFHVYAKDITFKQYNAIQYIIMKKINANTALTTRTKIAFSKIGFTSSKIPPFKNKLVDQYAHVGINTRKYVYDGYYLPNSEAVGRGYRDHRRAQPVYPLTSSELITYIMALDNGRLWYAFYLMMFADGSPPIETNTTIINADKNELNVQYKIDAQNSQDCKTYSIAKIYMNKEDLMTDNDRHIFVDNKQVEIGQYAILLKEGEGADYYVRQENNQWVLEENADTINMLIQQQQPASGMSEALMCDVQNLECSQAPKRDNQPPSCLPLKVMDEQLALQLLGKIGDEESVYKSINHLDWMWDYAIEIIKLGKQRRFINSVEGKQYQLGQSAAEEIAAIRSLVSPHTKLRFLVTGQSNFIKKQRDILTFCAQYARTSHNDKVDLNLDSATINQSSETMQMDEMTVLSEGASASASASESPWWMYCKDTNAPLIPTFYYLLASAFVSGGVNKYTKAMGMLTKHIGQKDENDDHWVDKHSGEILSTIEFEQEDEWRIPAGEPIGNIEEKDEVDPKKIPDLFTLNNTSKYTQGVKNIVNTLTKGMFLSTDVKSLALIIHTVTNLMENSTIVPTKEAYEKTRVEAKKKKEKLMQYNSLVNLSFMYLTLSTFAVTVQTAIPSLQPRKTFPGCVRSFSGYPTTTDVVSGDISGLTYVACIASHFNNQVSPWTALKGNKPPEIIRLMQVYMEHIIQTPDIQTRINAKRAYLVDNEEDVYIPKELQVSRWTGFLPPQIPFVMPPLEPLVDSFLDKIRNKIAHGNVKQEQDLLVVKSKIIEYAMSIQVNIQNVMYAKDALLASHNKTFFSNACCTQEGMLNDTALTYFTKEDSNIHRDNLMVEVLSRFVRTANRLTKSMLSSNLNTKVPTQIVSPGFSRETIYRAFIKWCPFIPAANKWGTICQDNARDLRALNDVKSKIEYLTQKGQQYTADDFVELLQIIGRQNAVTSLHLADKSISCVQPLLIQVRSANLPTALREALQKVLVENEGKRALESLLASEIQAKKESLRFFLKKYDGQNTNLKSLVSFMQNGMKIDLDIGGNTRELDSTNAIHIRLQRIREFIKLCGSTFPETIKRQHQFKKSVPKYWKLNQTHRSDLGQIIGKQEYMKPYHDRELSEILNRVQSQVREIVEMAEYTHIHSTPGLDTELVSLLMEYYWVYIFYAYMAEGQPQSDSNENADDDDDDIYGINPEISTSIANLISAFLQVQVDWTDGIMLNETKLENLLFEYKEAEKTTFTDRLKNLSQDERQSESSLQQYKIGRWRVGEEKGFRKYDPAGYVEKRDTALQVSSLVDSSDKADQMAEEQINDADDKEKEWGSVYGDDDDIDDDEYTVEYQEDE